MTSTEYELDWFAFCYITDELSSEELERFEVRLEQDQLAREAVARAVEMHSALEAVCESQPKRTSYRPMIGIISSAAAIVFAFIAFELYNESQRDSELSVLSNVSETTPAEADSLVGDWLSDTYSQAESNPLASDDLPPHELLEPELDVPDWLLTAVSYEDILPDSIDSFDSPDPDAFEKEERL